jgi:hypothetical protein
MKSQYLAKLARPGRARNVSYRTLAAPTAGWSTVENLANTSPATAMRLDNFRPTTTGIVCRGGSRTHATISGDGSPVISMMNYNAPLNKKLFAATEVAIFDVTSVADAHVPPAAAVTGQTSGYYSFVDFTTSGGSFMTAVNGTDPLLLYDPVNGWRQITAVSAPAITGLATSQLSFVWVYKNRQFFIESASLRAHYLPVGSIAGALKTIDLNGVMQRGGYLVFGATWSGDAGDGLGDRCVFVTSEGEAAIYQGGDPDSTTDWQLVGRYDLTKPLGPRATMRAGGDLIVCTEDGLVPIAAAIAKDVSILNLASISRQISKDWQREAVARRSLPWEIVKWPEKAYAIVSVPVTTAGQPPISFVVNTVTGAWCRYTNWDTRCLILHNSQLYFGTNDGRVMLAEVGGNDDGAGIYYTCVSNPDHLGQRGSLKTVLQGRASYVGSTPYIDRVSVSMDYSVVLPSPPSTAPDAQANEWDAGKWDDARWDATASPALVQGRWVSLGRTGFAIQYQIQITGALTPLPDTEFISLDVSFETGGVIVG